MAYLRIISPPLERETKRRLVEDLTALTVRHFPGRSLERTAIHFIPFDDADFATGGRFAADDQMNAAHADVFTPRIGEETRSALLRELRDALALTFGDHHDPHWHVTVRLHTFDADDAAFVAADDAPSDAEADGSSAGANADRSKTGHNEEGEKPAGDGTENGRGAWLLWAGFALGAFGAYRWLSDRLAADVRVDVAPPIADPRGEAVDAGDPDPRTTSAPAAPSDAGP